MKRPFLGILVVNTNSKLKAFCSRILPKDDLKVKLMKFGTLSKGYAEDFQFQTVGKLVRCISNVRIMDER